MRSHGDRVLAGLNTGNTERPPIPGSRCVLLAVTGDLDLNAGGADVGELVGDGALHDTRALCKEGYRNDQEDASLHTPYYPCSSSPSNFSCTASAVGLS